MRTPYHNKSCLILWMSDHFGDGWDTAVLTVRAPDLTNDTFHPHCDQVSCMCMCTSMCMDMGMSIVYEYVYGYVQVYVYGAWWTVYVYVYMYDSMWG